MNINKEIIHATNIRMLSDFRKAELSKYRNNFNNKFVLRSLFCPQPSKFYSVACGLRRINIYKIFDSRYDSVNYSFLLQNNLEMVGYLPAIDKLIEDSETFHLKKEV